MSSTDRQRCPSKYKFVTGIRTGQDKEIQWVFHKKGVSEKRYPTEREAAVAADRWLLENGFKAVNILTKREKITLEGVISIEPRQRGCSSMVNKGGLILKK